MPDAAGRIKGISVPAIPWHEIPQKYEAQEKGCTCQWYTGGMIAAFDDECPILDRHHIPDAHLTPRRAAWLKVVRESPEE